jgi:hypothetical protein
MESGLSGLEGLITYVLLAPAKLYSHFHLPNKKNAPAAQSSSAHSSFTECGVGKLTNFISLNKPQIIRQLPPKFSAGAKLIYIHRAWPCLPYIKLLKRKTSTHIITPAPRCRRCWDGHDEDLVRTELMLIGGQGCRRDLLFRAKVPGNAGIGQAMGR